MRRNLKYIFIGTTTTIFTNINISRDINIKPGLALSAQLFTGEEVLHLGGTGQEFKSM